MPKKDNSLTYTTTTGDTLEQRIMKSNLSDDDKIELIKKLGQPVYIYPYQYPYWNYTYCKDTPVSYTTTGNISCK